MKNINTLLIVTLIALIALYMFRNNPEPQDPMTSYYQEQIEKLETKQISYIQEIEKQQNIIDSLKQVKKGIDTLYYAILNDLQSLNLSGQYNMLADNLHASCNLKMTNTWYYYKGDTLLAIGFPELLCINTNFVEKNMYQDKLGITEELLNKTEGVVILQDSLLAVKDSIILHKDSIIRNYTTKIESIQKDMKRQRWYTRGAIGIAIGILIFK